MLSITKINAQSNQSRTANGGAGYAHYLGAPTTRQRGDFDDYARGQDGIDGPPPFWACKGPALLGLDDIAEAEQVERLAHGLHPITGKPLVKGSGDGHVMGLDMTFSAPKDVSAVFAGADGATREAVIECLQLAAKTALDYAESAAITRHGHGGRMKQLAEAAVAACYTHFASRALDPQLHVHAFMFNLGKRNDAPEWSALEHRPQFERKMATGILFRVELASRLKGLGFQVEPTGPYFAIKGISEAQRIALSTRSREIAEYMQQRGMGEADSTAAREIAALNSRSAKAEPPLEELLTRFEASAASIGLTREAISAMKAGMPTQSGEPPFAIDHAELLEALMAAQSCATHQEALALICERAMGHWSAAECLAELERFMAFEHVVHLGRTEHLTPVFTSVATRDLEASIDLAVSEGHARRNHRVADGFVAKEFDRLERELSAKLGVPVSLAQQRAAARHIACDTGTHAFVEGWAGTGKTTMLRAVGVAYKQAGFSVLGCCQSAAASQNLARETDIPSRTIASLLLSLRENRAHLHAKSIVVLDEAGMVGSREFSILQAEAAKAGAKLVCVGDPKQLQPIEAGGIFGSLMRKHGRAEISNIQRQRTDFEPLLRWLCAEQGVLAEAKARTLRELPEDARMAALESLCEASPKLTRAFGRWRDRYDFEWMREAVELFAQGESRAALDLMDAKDRLRLCGGQQAAFDDLVEQWSRDKTPLPAKAIVAATRAEVAELNRMARDVLISKGIVRDAEGIEVEITHRDDTTDKRRFAPGDRMVFTLNDRQLGVANGTAGTLAAIERDGFGARLIVELDALNERNETRVAIPAAFGRFDHAYCLTNHKSQGRTFDSAHVMANPSMCDREWTYVAASRSRYSTTLYVNAAALGLVDPESHREAQSEAKGREAALDALAARMRRSRAKGTSLDYEGAKPAPIAATPQHGPLAGFARASVSSAKKFLAKLRAPAREHEARIG